MEQTRVSFGMKIGIVILALVTVISSASIFIISRILTNEDKTVNGVYIKNYHLGKLSKDQVLDKLQQIETEIQSKVVTIQYQKKNWTLNLKDIDIKLNKELMSQQVYDTGREGSWLEQLKERNKISKEGKSIPLAVSFDQKRLVTQIKGKAGELIVKPQNANYKITPQYSLQLIPSKIGFDIDYQPIIQEMANIIKYDSTNMINLRLKEVQPKVTDNDIRNMKVNGVVATFSTVFDAKKANRAYNVIRGAKTLDGVVIKPGEVFSFNKVVGPRNKKNGYKEAPEIVKNSLVMGVGGGICQVSTTLFNSILLANLPVMERSNHSIPVHYVPLGRDATVTTGGKDFKFKNNTNGYLIIKTSYTRNSITFRILGNTANRRRVDLNTQTVDVIPSTKVVTQWDDSIAVGKEVIEQKPAPGYRVRLTQRIWNGGKLVKTIVYISKYKPQDKIILKGTRI